jgi:hypothetical protein
MMSSSMMASSSKGQSMNDVNAETIQQRIQIARRDAEALKDRIRRLREDLADTTRTLPRVQLVQLGLGGCDTRCCPY